MGRVQERGGLQDASSSCKCSTLVKVDCVHWEHDCMLDCRLRRRSELPDCTVENMGGLELPDCTLHENMGGRELVTLTWEIGNR